jgi:proteasome accessory factor C
VVGDCHLAGAERRFRVDRIEDLEVLEEQFERRPVEVPLDEPFRPGPDSREVRLAIPSDARWVLETYPSALAGEEPDGRLVVVLHVAGPAWLERLLLRLGPGAVVREPAELADVGRRAADRLLRRYERAVSA